MVEKLRIK